MTPATRRRSGSIRLALAAALVAVMVGSTTACAPRELVDLGMKLINQDRAAAGLGPLASNDNSASKAQAWAEHMAATHQISHSPLSAGITGGWSTLAENVGYGPNMATVESLFMRSATHRAAILSRRFTAVGVGVAQSGNLLYVVYEFRG